MGNVVPIEKPTPVWLALKEQAVTAYRSGLLPKAVDTPEKAITIAMMGRELGIEPMQSLIGIYVVNGMAALRGSLMLRLIYERVPGAKVTVTTPPEKADKECVVELQRPGGNVQKFRYTLEDAKKGGFLNKPVWQQHTSTMLRWAAIRTGARIVFADALAGCYMEDEIPNSNAQIAPPEEPEAVQAAIVESGPPTDFADPDPLVSERYVVPFGKNKGKPLSEIDPDTLKKALAWSKKSLDENEAWVVKAGQDRVMEFIDKSEQYLSSLK